MSEEWQNNKLKRHLFLNNIVKGADRRLSGLLAGGNSLRSRRFMRSLPACNQVQKWIQQYVVQDSPFAVVRFGLFEYMLCYQFLEKQNGLRRSYSAFIRQHICLDAGLFPAEDVALDEYAALTLSQLNTVDVLAYWRDIPEACAFSNFYQKDVRHINVEDLYPFPFWHSENLPDWQLSLKGKRVLVVSAFTETIQKQYAKRGQLWVNCLKILPDFELVLYRAVQTNGGLQDKRFPSWREALAFMTREILRLNFDLALISCGAYGMPLVLSLKQHGRKAIQWGGCFQLWFGILGRRWSTDPEVLKYVNKAWVYPSARETPPLSERVNGACYWK